MFRKRELKISVVKSPKHTENSPEEDFEENDLDTILMVSAGLANVVRQITVGVCIYLAADTARQVIVAKASR